MSCTDARCGAPRMRNKRKRRQRVWRCRADAHGAQRMRKCAIGKLAELRDARRFIIQAKSAMSSPPQSTSSRPQRPFPPCQRVLRRAAALDRRCPDQRRGNTVVMLTTPLVLMAPMSCDQQWGRRRRSDDPMAHRMRQTAAERAGRKAYVGVRAALPRFAEALSLD